MKVEELKVLGAISGSKKIIGINRKSFWKTASNTMKAEVHCHLIYVDSHHDNIYIYI